MIQKTDIFYKDDPLKHSLTPKNDVYECKKERSKDQIEELPVHCGVARRGTGVKIEFSHPQISSFLAFLLSGLLLHAGYTWLQLMEIATLFVARA